MPAYTTVLHGTTHPSARCTAAFLQPPHNADGYIRKVPVRRPVVARSCQLRCDFILSAVSLLLANEEKPGSAVEPYGGLAIVSIAVATGGEGVAREPAPPRRARPSASRRNHP